MTLTPLIFLTVYVAMGLGHIPGVKVDRTGAAVVSALALGTGFASNLIVFGSLAGIIVVEQAASQGVKISFGEFARAGVPTAIACMAVAAAWIAMLT